MQADLSLTSFVNKLTKMGAPSPRASQVPALSVVAPASPPWRGSVGGGVGGGGGGGGSDGEAEAAAAKRARKEEKRRKKAERAGGAA